MIKVDNVGVHLSGTGAQICAELGCAVAGAIEFVAKDCGDKFANKVVNEAIAAGKENAKKYGEPTKEDTIAKAYECLDDLDAEDLKAALKHLVGVLAGDGKEKNDG